MENNFNFKIEKKLEGTLARAGVIHTPHGDIQTPSFVVVGTKANVKGVTPEMLKDLDAQVVLANTYHLYFQPGDELVAKAGGFAPMMNWDGPTMTDSGGFQVFSLGAAFGSNVSKVAKGDVELSKTKKKSVKDGGTGNKKKLAQIDEEGVTFKSHLDGSMHRFTPERSMEIQWNLGADMIFAFDECTSPQADYEYQKEAMDRTHRWALRSLKKHWELDPENKQALFGVVQGGRHEDLRKESAKVLAEMKTEEGFEFDGFGIGGSFDKDDMATAVKWVNEALPEEKPRHLLGIGEPMDLFNGVENGCDLFDCVSPTRVARHGVVYTMDGPVHIRNAQYKEDFSPIDPEVPSYTSQKYTKSYLCHLFRSGESLAGTLASVHNLYFIVNLMHKIRQSLLDGTFQEFKKEFLARYYKK
jgi:queuine tRNA-ribosyltransferase